MRSLKAGLAVLAIAATAGNSMAAEVKLISAIAIRASINELIPEFERKTGHKVTVKFELNPVVKKQVEGGEPFDRSARQRAR